MMCLEQPTGAMLLNRAFVHFAGRIVKVSVKLGFPALWAGNCSIREISVWSLQEPTIPPMSVFPIIHSESKDMLMVPTALAKA